MQRFALSAGSLASLLLAACGSAPEVPDDCLDYLDCAAIIDPGNLALYEETYGEDAECWTLGSSHALSCTQSCQAAMEAAHMGNPGEQACWPNGLPDMMFALLDTPSFDLTEIEDCAAPDDNAVVGFSAESPGQTFAMEFEVTLWGSNEWRSEHSCVATGWDFNCEPYDNASQTEVWTFQGSFSDGFDKLDLTVDVAYEGGTDRCTWQGSAS